MRIRLFPVLIAFSLLALVATACSAPQDAQPGPSLAPALTAVASAAPAASNAEQSNGASCAQNACKKDLGTPSAGGAPSQAAAEVAQAPEAKSAISLPAEERLDSQANVTVEVTPAGGTSATLIFDVSMNTHSVELGYDMKEIATLTDDQGRAYPAKSWNGAAGGHHREGSLIFEVPAGAAPKSLELNLAGIGGAPSRLFKWDVQ